MRKDCFHSQAGIGMRFLRRLKNRLRGYSPFIPEVFFGLVELDRIYRSPPLTDEYVSAIRLITPPCSFPGPEEKYRDVWEQFQNASCWAEYHALQPWLGALAVPRRVLEIGPGLGRSLVFFSKMLDWNRADIHAYEGNGTETNYTKLGPRFEDSFCGNIQLLKEILAYNDVRNVTVHDAADVTLDELPGPFDLIYSFYSIGFHWSLEHFLKELFKLLTDDGVAIFTIPPNFEPFAGLERLHHQRIPLFPNARKANRRYEILLLSRRPLTKAPVGARPAASLAS